MRSDSWRPGHTSGLTDRRQERDVLDRLVNAVRAGESRMLVVSGDPGVGKTAPLDYLAGRAGSWRMMRVAGVQSEMELAFAGLHQLCAPMLDRLDRLPGPQREALRTAFGISAGPAPDRFLVGLAVLGVLSEVAGECPLLCLVDDAQWLDRTSAQVLGFVARRLAAEPLAMVFATRESGEDLAGLPKLAVGGLAPGDARELLDSVLAGPLDGRVRDLIVAETRGNPLALLELPRGLSPAELAGFGAPRTGQLAGQIEASFRRQLDTLPEQTRRLLLLAAADPTGDPSLVWQAAGSLEISGRAAEPAVQARLVEFGERIRFRHPLVRSAIYTLASFPAKQQVHCALAEATDPVADPDRRAWHRAAAAEGPDEEVAAELASRASQAQARGGLAAAAAFLERAALLTPDPLSRASRLVAAARAKRDAGELDAALGLLTSGGSGPLDPAQAAEAEHLRGQIALDQRHGSEAGDLLLSAAQHLQRTDPPRARITYLEAFWAAIWAGDWDCLREAAEAARAAPPGTGPERAVDLLLDALTLRFTEGYAAAAPTLAKALDLVVTRAPGVAEVERWNWHPGALVALQMWDFESWQAIAVGQARQARETGALVHLQFALTYLARTCLLTGELATAAQLIDEDRMIADAAGNPPFQYSAMLLAAWRGQQAQAAKLIEATMRQAVANGLAHSGQGLAGGFAACASAALNNGLGRYDMALDAVRNTLRHDAEGYVVYAPLAVPELAEAAAKTGELALLTAIRDWLSERTRVTTNDWLLGIDARVRALLKGGAAAESHYRESVERLGRTRLRAELARSRLLYGEWLRRQRRRGEAREQLRTAYEMLDEMGMLAFAGRARRELLATGETIRKTAVRSAASRADEALTPQETQVARLAREGLSNPEIAARLFISARTVQYHLSKVFTKLGISSRGQLHQVLPSNPDRLRAG